MESSEAHRERGANKRERDSLEKDLEESQRKIDSLKKCLEEAENEKEQLRENLRKVNDTLARYRSGERADKQEAQLALHGCALRLSNKLEERAKRRQKRLSTNSGRTKI